MQKIKNFEKLAITPERQIALQILEEGLQAIDTRKAILDNVRLDNNEIIIAGSRYDLSTLGNIVVVGVGKCALEAVRAIDEVLGEKISSGIVLDVHQGEIKNNKIKTFAGDHPYPSARNVAATKEIIDLLKKTKENDLVIFAISGGGSALLSQPKKITPEEEHLVTETFFKAGAPIQDMNLVRKHLSYAKGGFLAEYASNGHMVSLIFSDVPGDDMHCVSSGPTVFDTSSIDDAKKIIAKYDLSSKVPFIEEALIETPKDRSIFEKIKNNLIVSNKIALGRMKEIAEANGLDAKIMSTDFCGFAEDLGKSVLRDLSEFPPKTALLYGGESTVIVKKPGKGGRNLVVSLSVLNDILDNQFVISLASDGKDNTDFAGGICDTITKKKAEKMSLDPVKHLEENNSYAFFEKTGDYIETGDTGSNVSDIILAINY